MKLRNLLLLLPLAAAGGCLDDSATSPRLETSVFNVLGGLDVGEALTLQGSDAQEVLLAGRAAGADYLYVPFFAADSGGATLQVKVTGSNLLSAGASTALAPAPGLPGRELEAAPQDLLWHHDMRERMHARMAPLLRASPARRAQLRGSLQAAAAPAPVEGQVIPLRTPNLAARTMQEFCTPRSRSGRVMAVTDRAIVVADVENPAGDLPAAEYRRIGQEFDRLVWPVNLRNFGAPTDLDTNQRVILFFTPAVNQLTPPGTKSQGYVGGFFWPLDLFNAEEIAAAFEMSCPLTNYGEIFYLLAPDPGAAFGNPFSTQDVAVGSTGTVGHEFQHLINDSRRLYVNDAEEWEEGWLNEGLSHVAEELLFYEVTGLKPRANLGLAQVQANFDAWLRYQFQNFARYASYLESSDAESLMGAENRLETRGAAWAFLRYAADHRAQSDAQFFTALVNSRVAGLSNLNQVLKAPARELMQSWTVSVYTDDHVKVANPLYTQPSWNFRTGLQVFRSHRNEFPLQVQRLAPGATLSLDLLGGGSAFVELRAGGESPAVVKTSAGSSGVAGGLRVSVVRVR